MSRIGKQPVSIPGGVTITASGADISVKGPKGTLSMTTRPEVAVDVQEKEAVVSVTGAGPARLARAYHGMTRALLSNMVEGVTKGYSKTLEIHGVGWNAQAQPKQVVLNIGFCHPVNIPLPEGVTAECPNPTAIILAGANKQDVGQVAANIRAVRPPEPYKGKGIRYKGEFVRRKAGKSFGS
jgi:large subunit ribosomal protein L6